MTASFYTYILARPNGVPFYVGKGMGKRWTLGGNEFSRNVARKVHRAGDKVKVMIFAAADEAAAFRCEVELIAAYGRRDLGTGVLCNLTGGGEGAAGMLLSDVARANRPRRWGGRSQLNTEPESRPPSEIGGPKKKREGRA